MEYSNPRKEAVIEDWPYGNKRVTCTFSVEENKGKERAVRVTGNPKGGTNKPKKLTYANKVLIVDGDDGKTYLLNHNGFGISVTQSNMKYQEEFVIEGNEQYAKLDAMFH